MRVKDEILARLGQGKSFNQIAREVGCSKGTVSFHANRIGHVILRESSNNRYDWAEVQKYYDEGHSRIECLKHFGIHPSSWDKAKKSGRIVVNRDYRIPLEELLVSDRPKTTRHHLKRRLLQAGLLENKCQICGIDTWLGYPLVLELDHINGRETDNRLENLRLLCPNCHSQTVTYCNQVNL